METPSRLSKTMLLLVAAYLLAACTSPPKQLEKFSGGWLVNGRVTPHALIADVPRHARSPRLAVVLGGGGLRGYAHIGVLQALNDAGIYPDMVVGTSIGALIGAAYASGLTPAQLWQQANSVNMISLADIAWQGPGFVKGEALAQWTNSLVKEQRIDKFPTQFAAVTTDAQLAIPYVITAGDAGEAIRASASIPGVFLPVSSSGHPFIDGGVTALVPVKTARALGAEVVIAVDIYCHGPRYSPSSAVGMWLTVAQMQSCIIAQPEASSADILIAPAVTPASLSSKKERETVRQLGYDATVAQLTRLRKTLQQNQKS